MTSFIPHGRNESQKSFSLSTGQLLRRGLTIFSICEEYGDHIVIQHITTFERKIVTRSALYEEYLNNQLIPCNQADISKAISGDIFSQDDDPIVRFAIMGMSEAATTYGRKMMRYIQELQHLGYTNLRPTPILELDFERTKNQLNDSKEFTDGVHYKLSTVYAAFRRYSKSGGDWTAVFPNYSGRGRDHCRLNPVVKDAIEKQLLILEKESFRKIEYSVIHSNVEADIYKTLSMEEAASIIPSRSTIERLTKRKFSSYEICKRNKGKTNANRIFRSHYPRDRAERPLEVIEFDDKDTRVFLIDERTSLPWGRAYVTFGIDQYSSVPLGFSISHKPRSSWSAINAFASCILPKNLNSPEFKHVKSGMEFFGSPGIAIFDNAMYNHSRAISSSILEISNSTVAWSKPRTPTEKSIIEDFNGQMTRKLLHTLPGFGGAKESKDGLSDGLNSATMTIQDFRALFMKWTYDDFCNTPRASGLTPRQMWHEGMRDMRSRIPSNLYQIEAAVGIPITLQLRPDGILFTGLIYQNSRLENLRKKIGANYKITFRFNPQNLDKIYVLNPIISEYFIVPSTRPEYTTSLTLYQHKLIRKMARSNGIRNPSRPQLLFYRQQLSTLATQARYSTRLRERKKASRMVDEELFPIENEYQPPLSDAISDITHQIDEIDEIEVEVEDEHWDLPEDF